jgi:amidohydrolase
VTGLKAIMRFGGTGPTVAVIGELDSLRVPGHSLADPDTGAAHACGHHTQPAQLLGVAAALGSPEVAGHLSGSAAFMATPAEEFIDLGRRLERHEAGELGFMSGKQEMIRLGTFDDVDMAMMVHTSSEGELGTFSIGGSSNAHVVHMVKFKGKAAHAGGAPWDGVNALQAANVAMVALNAQRETFQNSDTIRVHGIITSAGVSMNSVPAEVVYEGRVRGRTSEIVDATAVQVERCFRAGALALGAEVEITSVAGYMALANDPVMGDLFAANADALTGPGTALHRGARANRGGSTDMGDLSQIMPVIHPYVTAATGAAHGIDYLIEDYYSAVVTSASALAMTVIDLLADDAANAKAVLKEAKPAMTREQYVSAQQARMRVTRYKGQ